MAIALKRIQHVGVPVANLESSLLFYREVFGVEPEFTGEGDHPRVSAAVGIPDAKIKFAFLEVGGAYLELLEYTSPRGKPYDRRNCDVGAVHVCFEVDDIEHAWAELKAKGVEVSADPFTFEEGPLTGYSFAYFKDPDGVQLELFQVPA
jgi:catechol 2,3-dioxygenase-like lactoylglutathione lyase family enzyme